MQQDMTQPETKLSFLEVERKEMEVVVMHTKLVTKIDNNYCCMTVH